MTPLRSFMTRVLNVVGAALPEGQTGAFRTTISRAIAAAARHRACRRRVCSGVFGRSTAGTRDNSGFAISEEAPVARSKPSNVHRSSRD